LAKLCQDNFTIVYRDGTEFEHETILQFILEAKCITAPTRPKFPHVRFVARYRIRFTNIIKQSNLLSNEIVTVKVKPEGFLDSTQNISLPKCNAISDLSILEFSQARGPLVVSEFLPGPSLSSLPTVFGSIDGTSRTYCYFYQFCIARNLKAQEFYGDIFWLAW